MLTLLSLHFWISGHAYPRTLNAWYFAHFTTGAPALHTTSLKRLYLDHWTFGYFVKKWQIQAIHEPVHKMGNKIFRYYFMDMGTALCCGTHLRIPFSVLNFQALSASLHSWGLNLCERFVKAGKGFGEDYNYRFWQEDFRESFGERNWVQVERRSKR